MSALPPEADIRQRIEHVCLVPEADTEAHARRHSGDRWSAFFDPVVAVWPQQRRTVVAIIHVLA